MHCNQKWTGMDLKRNPEAMRSKNFQIRKNLQQSDEGKPDSECSFEFENRNVLQDEFPETFLLNEVDDQQPLPIIQHSSYALTACDGRNGRRENQIWT
jgi:hypothetical protein